MHEIPQTPHPPPFTACAFHGRENVDQGQKCTIKVLVGSARRFSCNCGLFPASESCSQTPLTMVKSRARPILPTSGELLAAGNTSHIPFQSRGYVCSSCRLHQRSQLLLRRSGAVRYLSTKEDASSTKSDEDSLLSSSSAKDRV